MEYIKTEKRNATNALGGSVTVYDHTFKVDQSDVGKVIHHVGGYNYADHRVSLADVGKTFVKMSERPDHTAGGWCCWSVI